MAANGQGKETEQRERKRVEWRGGRRALGLGLFTSDRCGGGHAREQGRHAALRACGRSAMNVCKHSKPIPL